MVSIAHATFDTLLQEKALYISHIALSITEDDIREYFGFCGAIKDLVIFPSLAQQAAILVFEEPMEVDWDSYAGGMIVELLQSKHAKFLVGTPLEDAANKHVLAAESMDHEMDIVAMKYENPIESDKSPLINVENSHEMDMNVSGLQHQPSLESVKSADQLYTTKNNELNHQPSLESVKSITHQPSLESVKLQQLHHQPSLESVESINQEYIFDQILPERQELGEKESPSPSNHAVSHVNQIIEDLVSDIQNPKKEKESVSNLAARLADGVLALVYLSGKYGII